MFNVDRLPTGAARSLSARSLAFAVAFFTAAWTASAQDKLLTIDDIYHPEKKIDFEGNPPSGLVWLDDEHYLWPRTESKTAQEAEWLKVHAATGRSEPFFDAARMEAALSRLPGVTEDDARKLARQKTYQMNEEKAATLLTIGSDLYVYRFGEDRATRLTYSPEAEEQASFSPDGKVVAFVRSHNLYMVDVETQREWAITTDGTAEIINGKLDWVYQEEIYGRGNFRGYWWSPDASRLAFLRFDERPVPEFTIVDHIPYRPEIEVTDYPKAGDPNPVVTLGVARVTGGEPVPVDLDRYAAVDILIVNVGWTPDSAQVAYQIQDREQTWLDLNLADARTGRSMMLLRETTKAWVNDNGPPTWLKDGSFLWLSERSGWKHLYHYRDDGTLVRQVTDGPREMRTLHGIDEERGWIYFSGTEGDATGLGVYRVRLDGEGLERVSRASGTHAALFDERFSHYLDTWSTLTTPPQVRVHRADGREVRVVDDNPVPALRDYRLSVPERLQVTTSDGFVMEAMMIKPPDFDPSRSYPVYQHTYAGPYAPQVRDAWGGATYLFHQLLAQRGIIVWICDNRTASGKGVESTWRVYQNFGELELRDIEDGLSWLESQPYVDGARIGISGWSFGGFMVSYALTHSRSFTMGIAGGPVTDWRDYDSIYTERFMRMPQNNPEGYRKSAPRFAAADLHGRLLLVHGTLDDNVHLQNTIQFAYELQKAGKPFRLMVYPKSRHALTDPLLLTHMRAGMLDFILETLAPADAGTAMTAERDSTESAGVAPIAAPAPPGRASGGVR